MRADLAAAALLLGSNGISALSAVVGAMTASPEGEANPRPVNQFPPKWYLQLFAAKKLTINLVICRLQVTDAERDKPMQHIFIINPTAGKVDASVALIPQIHAAASRAGLHPTIEVTRRAGQARDLAAQYAAGGEEVYLYACGGDGTLNEILQGTIGRPNAPLAACPAAAAMTMCATSARRRSSWTLTHSWPHNRSQRTSSARPGAAASTSMPRASTPGRQRHP